MKIEKGFYKNVPAYILDTGVCRAVVLPEDGGKIASFIALATGRELLLVRETDEYARIRMEDSFELGECSGFDDMFPTIDPERVTPDGKEYDYPDHGEICRVALSATVSDSSLTLTYTSENIPYSFTKTFTEGEGGEIKISYIIKNLSAYPLPALFAAHCLLRTEDGGRLIFPFGLGEPCDLISDTSGEYAAPVRIPLSEDFVVSREAEGNPHSKKIYFPNRCPIGRVEYEYPSGERFVMKFDSKTLCYLGIWYNYRGIRDDFCIGIEPASLGYDTVSAAKKMGQQSPIPSGESLEFYISIGVS